MEIYYALSFFLIGIILGSFYNVVGYRLPKGESLLFPPSHCPNCNHRLTPIELIPIFSFLLQGGKCKNCHKKIPSFYPFFEFMTGLLFMLSFLVFGFSLDLLIALTFVSMSLIIIISDYQYMIISDEVLVVSIIIFSVLIYFQSELNGLFNSYINGFSALIFMFCLKKFGDFLFKKESMGGGDIKLMFIMGMVLDFPIAILSVFLASFLGLPISLIILKQKKEEHIIPFGPFLVIASLIFLFAKIDFNYILSFYQI